MAMDAGKLNGVEHLGESKEAEIKESLVLMHLRIRDMICVFKQTFNQDARGGVKIIQYQTFYYQFNGAKHRIRCFAPWN